MAGKRLTTDTLTQVLERVKDECYGHIDDTAGDGDTTKVWSADKSERERAALNSAVDNTDAEIGIIYQGTSKGKKVLFTSSDIQAGGFITYKFTAELNSTGYIAFWNSSDERLLYFGKGSTSGTTLVYEGAKEIPEGFSYATAESSPGTLNVSYIYKGKRLTQKFTDIDTEITSFESAVNTALQNERNARLQDRTQLEGIIDNKVDNVSDSVENVSNELGDEISARSSADAAIIESVNAQTAEISKKVNLPLNGASVDYGTNGQTLRTKGDGTTEWADVGLPTDAQTLTAVTEWLDNHPEATTSVENWSLTYNKLVKGTLGFVTLKMFGAVGDGATDDTAAINEALSFCHLNRCILYAEKGTYIYDGKLEFGNIILIGSGIGSTIFKLKDNCTLPSSGILRNGFSVKPGLNDIKYHIFRNFEIDGNSSNNRHWTDVSYGSWANLQDRTQANGIKTEPIGLDGTSSNYAEYTEISSVYIHDTIRDSIIIASGGYVIIKDSIFENGDTDHLLYLQTTTGETFVENCVFKGFSNGVIQSSKAVFNNIAFKDLIPNPSVANLSGTITNIAFTALDRSSLGQKTGLTVSNVVFDNDMQSFSSNVRFLFFSAIGFINASNIYIDVHGNGNFIFFDANGNTNQSSNPSVGINADNIFINNLGNGGNVLSLSHECHREVILTNSKIYYSSRPSTNGIINSFNVPIHKGVWVNNIDTRNVNNMVRVLSALTTEGIKPIYVRNSHIDVGNDSYIIDGAVAFDGFLDLQNVTVAHFKYNLARPYVHYDSVKSLTDGDIKYLANPPESGNRIGDIWYKNGAIKFWNGSEWI